MKKKMSRHMRENTISVYGLGKMGLPLALVFAHNGFNVIGVDSNKEVVDNLLAGKTVIQNEEYLNEYLDEALRNVVFTPTIDGVDASKKSKIKIIIVPTFVTDDNKPDLSIVKTVSKTIGKGLKKGDIVILESTAPPGTTMEVIAPILSKMSGLKLHDDFSVAHCPERTNSGTAIKDIEGRINPKVIGSSDPKTTSLLTEIYSQINQKGVVSVSSPNVAEMVKVSEGIYRDVNIALANNLTLIMEELGIQSQEVFDAANTDMACHFLHPGPGVGGHCIPVYPYFILDKIKMNSGLISLARTINDGMTQEIVQRTLQVLETYTIRPEDVRILVMGLTYRGDVKETRKSPALSIIKELQRFSKHIYASDPLYSKEEVETFNVSFMNSFDGLDAVIIASDHTSYRSLDWKQIRAKMRTPIIVDTKQIVPRDHVVKLGFRLYQIGYDTVSK